MNIKVINNVVDSTVKTLKDFGYDNVNKNNLYTNELYRDVFEELLHGNEMIVENYPQEYQFILRKIEKHRG